MWTNTWDGFCQKCISILHIRWILHYQDASLAVASTTCQFFREIGLHEYNGCSRSSSQHGNLSLKLQEYGLTSDWDLVLCAATRIWQTWCHIYEKLKLTEITKSRPCNKQHNEVLQFPSQDTSSHRALVWYISDTHLCLMPCLRLDLIHNLRIKMLHFRAPPGRVATADTSVPVIPFSKILLIDRRVISVARWSIFKLILLVLYDVAFKSSLIALPCFCVSLQEAKYAPTRV